MAVHSAVLKGRKEMADITHTETVRSLRSPAVLSTCAQNANGGICVRTQLMR